jgi:hypothetical protein
MSTTRSGAQPDQTLIKNEHRTLSIKNALVLVISIHGLQSIQWCVTEFMVIASSIGIDQYQSILQCFDIIHGDKR